MRCRFFLLIVLSGLPCVAQSYPDVEALLELAFTMDPAVVKRHLPVDLVNALEELPPNEQLAFERELMISEKVKDERLSLTRSEVPPGLVEIRKQGDSPDQFGTIFLDKRICDGYESLLRLKLKSPENHDDTPLLVWMRFEEGEWRILELGPAEVHDRFNFEDTSMLLRFRVKANSESEAFTVGSLRTYNTALVTYSASYPQLGFASRLDRLGGSDPANPSADHAGLVDPLLSTEPYEKSGYRFTYRPATRNGVTAAYALIARPIGYGPSSKRSFFTDESGVIRWTEEDREPTADDPAIP